MGSTILDQTGDSSRERFFRMSRLYPLPDYVKQASSSLMEPDPTLPTTAFADIVSKQFPCNTKAATFLSWLYFLDGKPELNKAASTLIENRLTRFAEHWGISKDVQELREKHARAQCSSLNALPDSAFAIVWSDADGGKARHLPMRNGLEVKAAAAWFKENRDTFKWDDRQTIARKILDKANEKAAALDPATDEILERTAGLGLYVPSKAAEMIRHRVRAAQRVTPEVKEGMLKLADSLQSNPILAIDPATSSSLARTIDQFDREHHLAGKYSALVPRPEDIFFETTLKSAGTFVKDACTLVTGVVFEKAQFSKLAISEVRALLGDEIADAVADGIEVDVEKMADVAETLPRPDAQRLEALLSDVGEIPRHKNAQAVGASAEAQAGYAEIQDFLDSVQPVGIL